MKYTMLTVFRILFTIVALAAFAQAAAMRRGGPSPSKWKPGPTPHPTHKKTCQVGPVECCPSVVSVDSPAAQKVLNALNIWVDPNANYDVGLSCVPVDKLQHKESDCNTNLVCCEDHQHEGIINLQCTPAATNN